MGIFDSLFGRKRTNKATPESPIPIALDPVGQPPPALNLHVRMARDINEILGVLRGLCADGFLSNEEIVFLGRWIMVNSEFITTWPLNVLSEQLTETLNTWPPDEESRAKLHGLINQINGTDGPEAAGNRSTVLPFTEPPPPIIFEDREFVLTGTFNYNVRRECQEAIEHRGGRCARNVTRQTNYLVIGEWSSRDWITTSWGRKIETAVAYKEKYGLVIVSEAHWAAELTRVQTSANRQGAL